MTYSNLVLVSRDSWVSNRVLRVSLVPEESANGFLRRVHILLSAFTLLSSRGCLLGITLRFCFS